MPRIEVAEFEDKFVIHFGGEFHRVNAYTLASTLVGIADAAKAANATLNPGHDIEVVVEALSDGSFTATVRTLFTGAKNLFSAESAKAIVLSVIASFIYQHTLAPHSEVTIKIEGDEVLVVQGDRQVVIPRRVHEAVKEVERSPAFRKGVGDALRAVESDAAITSLGFGALEAPEAPVPIPREQFSILARELDGPEQDERELVETTDLQIVRAILERSKRRWQFVWNGVRVSAPVSDDKFYQDFFDHKVTIAPGDVLRVRLRIRQKRHADLGIFINDIYEVLEVLEHIPRPRQGSF